MESIKDKELVFDYVQLYTINVIKKIQIVLDHIYILLIGSKKSTINPINKKENKCFQYAMAIILNHK